jgi:lipoprotein-anchoring transpeptidase ErfK/SrfK
MKWPVSGTRARGVWRVVSGTCRAGDIRLFIAMTAIASPPSPIRLLVPPAALPPEDDDSLAGLLDDAAASDLSRALGWFQRLGRSGAVRLRLKGSELDWPFEPEAALNLVELEASDAGPALGGSPAGSHVSWVAVAEAFTRRTDPEHFIGGPVEAQRIVLDEIRRAAVEAARHFSGEPLPLVEVAVLGPDVTEFAFLGIWLGTRDEALELTRALPRQRWDETPAVDGMLLVLDDPEAEGRGLREAMLGALLAVVFTAQPSQAGLFGLGTAAPTPVMHESKATVDGTPLLVKSQKLVQPAPKIYPSGLASQTDDAPRKVIVDVKAQRAYLFVDGRLAFETPVSTASKGRVTPRGTFTITEKIRKGKRSTIYKCLMPYWNRLGQSAIGMHTGHLPGYPASHGCIRLPDEAARFIFDNAPRGTTVQVVDGLDFTPMPSPPATPAGDAMLASSR